MSIEKYISCRPNTVLVKENDGSTRTLSPSPSRAIFDHSPDGFAWGYGGSGPSQLGLALLFDYTGDREFATKNYRQFTQEVISRLPKDFQIEATLLDDWVGINGGVTSEKL